MKMLFKFYKMFQTVAVESASKTCHVRNNPSGDFYTAFLGFSWTCAAKAG